MNRGGPYSLGALFGILSLLVAGCGVGEDTEPEPVELATAVSTEPVSTQPVEPGTLDPNRFGEFPLEPNDRWLIGVDYAATGFPQRQIPFGTGSNRSRHHPAHRGQ